MKSGKGMVGMALKIGTDAGHGLNTSGKRTPDGEREWTFNDKMLKAFTAEIKKYKDVTVKRYDDTTGKTDVPLRTRTDKANADKCDVYISFHHNANTGKWGTWTGTEVHVYKNASSIGTAYKLAQKVAPALAKAYGLNNRGIKKTNLHITRETHMPAILIEGGFMDSTKDINKLRDDKVVKAVGVAIAKAVAEFYGLKLKPVEKPKTTTTTTTNTTTSTATTHTVKAGDTLYAIAKKYNTTVAKIQALNNMGNKTTLTVGQKLKVSGTVIQYHVVVKGDTLYAIAKKYNTTVAKIKELNNMKDNTLSIGQKLIVKK